MKAKLALASLIALSMSGVAMADDHGGPKLSGNLHVKYVETDMTGEEGLTVDTAEVNLKGAVSSGNLKAIYELQAEFANAANGGSSGDDNDITVDTARIIVPGKWGAFVLGKTPSGQYADLYKGVKIFDNASISRAGDGVYQQPSRAPGVVAWKTPKVGNVYGVIATVNGNNTDDNEVDAKVARVVYSKGGLTAGLGTVQGEHSDYERQAIGVNYDAKKWQVGATHEVVKDTQKVTGIAGTYRVNPATAVKLGYFDKTVDNNSAADDTTTILNVSRKFGNTKLYLEHEAHDLADRDQTAVGMVVSF